MTSLPSTELAAMGEATGQDWPTAMADLLVEICRSVQAAKADGHSKLASRRLAGYLRRWRTLIAEGRKLNPPPAPTGRRRRPALGRAGPLL